MPGVMGPGVRAGVRLTRSRLELNGRETVFHSVEALPSERTPVCSDRPADGPVQPLRHPETRRIEIVPPNLPCRAASDTGPAC